MSAEHAEIIGIEKTINARALSEVLEEMERETRQRSKVIRGSGGVAVGQEVDLGPVAFREEKKWLSPEDIADTHKEGGRF